MSHTAIPDDELKVFASLKNVKVVFDIGSRDDVDYLILKPRIQLHAFEPNRVFFEELKANIGKRKAHLNNFGLGSEAGRYDYCVGGQSTLGKNKNGPITIKTLDWYVEKHNITRIDFLKSDTEGSELEVFRGGKEAIKLCRYIQYETWNEPENSQIADIMQEAGFDSYYTGYRNIICVRKGEKMPWIPEEPQEGGLQLKTEANTLK